MVSDGMALAKQGEATSTSKDFIAGYKVQVR